MSPVVNMNKVDDMHVEALPIDEKHEAFITDIDPDAGLSEEEKRRLVHIRLNQLFSSSLTNIVIIRTIGYSGSLTSTSSHGCAYCT